MHIIHVYAHVKKDNIEAFKTVTIENASKSIKNEPGVARFDVVQQADDPSRFVLIEVYRAFEDAAKHKETEHYNRWRESVESMLAEPRSRIIYANVFPDDLSY